MIDIFDVSSDLRFAETKALSLYLSGKSSKVFDGLDPMVSDLKNYLSLMKYFVLSGIEEVAAESLILDYGMSESKATKLLDKLKNDEEFKI